MVDVPLKVVGTFDDSRLNAGLNKMQGRVRQVGQMMAAAFGAFVSVQALRGIWKATDATINYQNALKGLQAQTTAVGVSSRELLKSLQDVTEGQVSLRALTESSNKAIALLGTSAIPRFEELAEVATKASSVMGISVTQAFDDIVTGIGRQSRMILDNLGIVVSTTKAYEDYATELGVTVKQLTDAERKQAFMNAALDQANEKFGELAAQVSPMQELYAALDDLSKAVLGIFTAEIRTEVGGLAEAIRGLAQKIEESRAATTFWFEYLKIVLPAFIGLMLLARIRLTGIWTILARVIPALGKGALAVLAFSVGWQILAVAIAVGIPLLILAAAEEAKLRTEAKEFILVLQEQRTELQATATGILLLKDELKKLDPRLHQTGVTFQRLHDRVVELARANPELLEQIGYSITANDQLITAAGNVVGGLTDLQEMFSLFSTESFVDQMNQAMQAMRMQEVMREAEEGIRRATTWYNESVILITRGAEGLRQYREQVQQEWSAWLIRQQAEITGWTPIRAVPPADRVPTPISGAGAGVVGAISLGLLEKQAKDAAATLAFLEETAHFLEKVLKDELDPAIKVNTSSILVAAAALEWFSGSLRVAAAMMPGQAIPPFGAPTTDYGFGPGVIPTLGGVPIVGPWEEPEIIEKLDRLSEKFISNLSKTLQRFLENWGWEGGKPDLKGLARGMMRPAAEAWGGNLASFLQIGAGFAGPLAGMISGGAGWIFNRLMGDKPLEVEQPIDIRIVDIETRLLNFFNFRGMEPWAYSSGFRPVFENGLW